MDQQFESDVMHDLMADSPTVSADEEFEEDSYDDGFEEEGMEEDTMMDGMDQYDEDTADFGDEAYLGEDDFDESFGDDFGDDFAEEETNIMDAMEGAVANAMDAEDSDEFLRRLISGVRGVAGAVRRGAGTVGRVAGRAQNIAGQVGRVARGVQGLAGAVAGSGGQRTRRGARPRIGRARSGAMGSPLSGLLQQLLPMLQQHAAQGANEMDVFEDLADWFEQEDADEALPVLAGVAARAALMPLIRRSGIAAGRAVNRQLVRGATQAAQNLVRRQGPQAVRALQPIARSVGRAAVRRGMRPAALPGAIRQTAARVAAQPALAQRLSRPAAAQAARAGIPRSRLTLSGGGTPRRFVVNGPVEIIIRR